jgi:HSP20 family protein
MFTRMSDIDRMFGAMDLLRNRMDRFFGDFDRPFLSGPAFTLGRLIHPEPIFWKAVTNFEVQAEVPGVLKR